MILQKFLQADAQAVRAADELDAEAAALGRGDPDQVAVLQLLEQAGVHRVLLDLKTHGAQGSDQSTRSCTKDGSGPS